MGAVCRFLRSAPFVASYVLVSWAFFLPAASYRDGNVNIDKDRITDLIFHVPHLSQEPFLAIRSLATAPFINYYLLQILYVTVLLLLFGAAIERRHGTWPTVALFFGATMVAGLAAGALLHVIYPGVSDARVFERAWERSWSGGSLGCFGLMGAFAARSRRPWTMMGLFTLWEISLTLWHLQNYTPVFHLIALMTGFLLTRYAMAPHVGSKRENAIGAAGSKSPSTAGSRLSGTGDDCADHRAGKQRSLSRVSSAT